MDAGKYLGRALSIAGGLGLSVGSIWAIPEYGGSDLITTIGRVEEITK